MISIGRRQLVLLAATVSSLALAASVGAAGPALPVAANGHPVSVLATGVPTPTAFAFADSTIFAGSGPAQPGGGPGGLFVLAGGRATKLRNSPRFVFGLVWHSGSLYVSTGRTIVALRGWNGRSFAAQRTIYASRQHAFPGFNGLAFGPDGRLYAGLALNEDLYDHSKDPFALSQAVVSMTATGKDLRIVASGLRQPFQLRFPKGSPYPYVTVLGQDYGPDPNPPDEIVVAKSGQNYGFPTCTWHDPTVCTGFDQPLILLPAHASPMGISSIGATLYVALYTGIANSGPEVVTIPVAGGAPTPLLTGFGAHLIALGIHAGIIYVGDVSGTIYRVAA